jgi:hypothetical protein
MFFNYFKQLLFRKPSAFAGLKQGEYDRLYPDGLTMGTVYIGKQGSGKTTSLAMHLLDYLTDFPTRAVFILDWSGSVTDTLLTLILTKPAAVREMLLKRTVYDELGNDEWVVPMPEFSSKYGLSYEEQVQRVSMNLTKLAPSLVENAPLLAGLGLREIGSQVFRVLTCITNEHGESWQITEAKKLIHDDVLLKHALSLYGHKAPEAKWYLENIFLDRKKVSISERELRTYALLALLGTIEPRETRARIGYYQPGWTAKEAIEKGLLVIVNGSRLINQRNTQHYLFTQVYSLIMAEINKRQPGNPEDQPVALVMDEVYSLLSIPGMAEEIGMISPLYRSRKLELYVVIQALWQLAPTLREQIWSLGNVVCFSISNVGEAYEIAQQLFPYEPTTEKLPPKTDNQLPILEPDRGQYLKIANWIQQLKHRECLIRRYESEKMPDRYIRHVTKTRNILQGELAERLSEVKEGLLREKGVRVREALEIINRRNIDTSTGMPSVMSTGFRRPQQI